MKTPIIYKKDSTGRIRTWQAEVEGSEWRTHTGITGGKIVTTQWSQSVAASRDTDEAQALFEAEAEMGKKLKRGYFTSEVEAVESEFISPMLAIQSDKVKELEFPYSVQPKFEGIRALVSPEGPVTREAQPHMCIPHIVAALETALEAYPNVIFDGELYNHKFKHDFEKTCSFVKQSKPDEADFTISERLIQFHVYDLIILDENGKVTDATFQERYDLLAKILHEIVWPENENHSRYVQLAHTFTVDTEEDLDSVYAELVEKEGYEGLILRDPAATYACKKRNKRMIKMKKFMTAEFQVADIQSGNGNWAGRAKRIICHMPDGDDRTFGSGLRGNYDFTKKLLEDKEQYINTWVTVRFQGFTKGGKGVPRIPVVTEWHGAERNF